MVSHHQAGHLPANRRAVLRREAEVYGCPDTTSSATSLNLA